MSIYEAGMLLCFGVAWPVSIIRSYRSRSTHGKSLIFSIVVLVGYACGITHKLLYSRDLVLVLYLINVAMVFIDMLLWFRNRGIERRQEESARENAVSGGE